jgi:thiamine transporter ThiT
MVNAQDAAGRFLMPNWFTALECLMPFHVAVKLTIAILLLFSSQVRRKQNFLKTCIDMKLLSFFLGSFLKFFFFFWKNCL